MKTATVHAKGLRPTFVSIKRVSFDRVIKPVEYQVHTCTILEDGTVSKFWGFYTSSLGFALNRYNEKKRNL